MIRICWAHKAAIHSMSRRVYQPPSVWTTVLKNDLENPNRVGNHSSYGGFPKLLFEESPLDQASFLKSFIYLSKCRTYLERDYQERGYPWLKVLQFWLTWTVDRRNMEEDDEWRWIGEVRRGGDVTVLFAWWMRFGEDKIVQTSWLSGSDAKHPLKRAIQLSPEGFRG